MQSIYYDISIGGTKETTVVFVWDGGENTPDKPIAEINNATREVTYIDERAKTDPEAQRVIIDAIDRLEDKLIDNFCEQLKEIARTKSQFFIGIVESFKQQGATIEEAIAYFKKTEKQTNYYTED